MFQWNQTNWAEQSRVARWPITGVQGTVMFAGHIDIVKVLPFDLPAIEIGNAISGEIGHFNLKNVFAGTEMTADFFH